MAAGVRGFGKILAATLRFRSGLPQFGYAGRGGARVWIGIFKTTLAATFDTSDFSPRKGGGIWGAAAFPVSTTCFRAGRVLASCAVLMRIKVTQPVLRYPVRVLDGGDVHAFGE
ncbi:hypothetical protein [Cypionkella sinensis]|uniref:Uncharacterized protein n=1 Tax=Cypionkella sinensis TaxID=1756043 RepID=A0ABV7IXA7_9RHOB